MTDERIEYRVTVVKIVQGIREQSEYKKTGDGEREYVYVMVPKPFKDEINIFSQSFETLDVSALALHLNEQIEP